MGSLIMAAVALTVSVLLISGAAALYVEKKFMG